MTNEELGQWGEETACNLLASKGYKIVARNFRFNKNEIDIVLSKDAYVVSIVHNQYHTKIHHIEDAFYPIA